jgi:hypothetical protein
MNTDEHGFGGRIPESHPDHPCESVFIRGPKRR